jgi:hypothetical protein
VKAAAAAAAAVRVAAATAAAAKAAEMAAAKGLERGTVGAVKEKDLVRLAKVEIRKRAVQSYDAYWKKDQGNMVLTKGYINLSVPGRYERGSGGMGRGSP